MHRKLSYLTIYLPTWYTWDWYLLGITGSREMRGWTCLVKRELLSAWWDQNLPTSSTASSVVWAREEHVKQWRQLPDQIFGKRNLSGPDPALTKVFACTV